MTSPRVDCRAHFATPGISASVLTQQITGALPDCLAARGEAVQALLGDLEEIEISLLDDAAIAAVHGEFMDDPTPTDVITFHHGEILISVETAARCAADHGHAPGREALLYAIHGLLHLNGHDDRAEPERTRMHAAQERILKSVWPLQNGENRE